MKASVILYQQKTLKNGEHPLMLRLYDGKLKYQALGISLHKKDWNFKTNKLKSKKPRLPGDNGYQEYQDYLNLKNTISDTENKYNETITSLAKEGRVVSSEQLIHIVENAVTDTTVLNYFDKKIEGLTKKGKIGNAKTYRTAKNKLKDYLSHDIKFIEMNRIWLKKYKDWLEEQKYKDTSISVYLRTLRALYNTAIEEGYAKAIEYPFGRNSVIKGLSTDTEKRAITKAEVEKIWKLKLPNGSKIKDAQNYFMFGYYGWGINFIDMAYLKWSDIENDRISYVRYKTRGKKKKKISFAVTPQIKSILTYYKKKTEVSANAYVFPILDKNFHITPTQQKNRIHKVLNQVNGNLKEIAALTGIKTKLTTYVWRHTFATVLKNELNASTEVISEMMGHSDVLTTATYLAQFDNTVKDKVAEGL